MNLIKNISLMEILELMLERLTKINDQTKYEIKSIEINLI